MQHKALFAAMLVGAVSLASCVKSVESQSVTDVRKARAEEILSQAELNKANAQAAVISAQAEATIAAAQAKFYEAQAVKEQAQAALLQAQAELQQINNQIRLVKLDQEKEILKQKQAETQKLIAEYEKAIAQAEQAKQEAINALNNALKQAEIDEITYAKKLLDAEQQLIAATNNLDAEAAQAIQNAWTKYSAAMTKVNADQAELVQKKVLLAQAEAGIISDKEAAATQIAAYEKEIKILEMKIADYKKYATASSDELKEKLEVAREALAAANTAEQEALTAYNKANSEINYYDGGNRLYVWDSRPYENNWTKFQTFVNNHSSINKVFDWGYKYNEETKRGEYGLYFYDEARVNTTFVPLYTSDSNSWFDKGESTLYPEAKDGVAPANSGEIYDITFSPAKVYTENFDKYFEVLVDAKKKDVEKEKEDITEEYENNIEYIEGKIESLTAELEAYKAYVEEAAPEVEAARKALLDAEEIWNEAKKDRDAAQLAYNNYLTSQTSGPSAAANAERDASNDLIVAMDELEKAQEKYAAAEVAKEIADAAVKALVQAKYEADTTTAGKLYLYNQADKKLTPELKTAMDDAIKAVKDQEDVIAAAQKKVDDALADYRSAQIVYIQTRSEADEKTMNGKFEDWEDAVDDLEAEEAKLQGETGLIAKRDAAIEAYNKVKGPADKAKEDYEAAKKNSEAIAKSLGEKTDAASDADDASAWAVFNFTANAFETAGTALGKEDDTVAGTAYGNVYVAKEKFDAAHAANPDDSETYIALYDALQAAERVVKETNNDMVEAGIKLDVVYQKYHEYCWAYSSGYGYEKEVNMELTSYIYWTGSNVGRDDTTYKEMNGKFSWDNVFYVNVPRLHTPRIEWYEAKKIALTEEYEKNLAAKDKNVSDLEKEIAEVKTALAGFAAMEADYLAYGEKVEKAWAERNEAYKAYIDAQNAKVEPQSEYDAANNLLYGTIYVDANNVHYNVAGVENLIKSAEQNIENKKAQIEEYKKQMESGKDSTQATIVSLQNEIKKLEAEIEVYTKIADEWKAILDKLMGAEETPAA